MNKAYLLTGGNMGDRFWYVQQAREKIAAACGDIVAYSAIYETEAWGAGGQNPYLNQALRIDTPLAAPLLLRCLLEIERQLGRVRTEKYAPRTIDIDILLYNKEVIALDGLAVPHPQMPFRRFALQCLNDIAADEVHPVFGKTVQQLLAECTDGLNVKRMEGY